MGIELQQEGQRLYFTGDTFPIKDRLKQELGAKFDRDRKQWWCGAVKATRAKELIASLGTAQPPTEKTPQDPDCIRLTGKGEYKGRLYYIGSTTRDGTRVRLLTLPDATGKFLDFWVDTSAVKTVKTYSPREYRGRMEYTTLGSIAGFIARQKNPSTARVQCPECDAWHDASAPCSECGGC